MFSAISFQFLANKQYPNTLLIPENSDIQVNQKLQSKNPQSSLQIPCNYKDKERREIRVHRCSHLLGPPLRLVVPTVTSVPCRHNLTSTPQSDLIKVTVIVTSLFVLKLKPLNLIHMASHTYLVPNPFTPYPHLFTSTRKPNVQKKPSLSLLLDSPVLYRTIKPCLTQRKKKKKNQSIKPHSMMTNPEQSSRKSGHHFRLHVNYHLLKHYFRESW